MVCCYLRAAIVFQRAYTDNASAPPRSQGRITPVGSEAGRQKSGAGQREESAATNDDASQPSEARNPLGAIGKTTPSLKGKDAEAVPGADIQDPLAGMAPADKWGLKGLRTLMNNYPDYNAMVLGIDPSSLGLDLTISEYVSAGSVNLREPLRPLPESV
jgi:CCR4-NOT transcription complex subunit 2